LDVRTVFIEPGSPWENGSIESFAGILHCEFLNGDVFSTLVETLVVTNNGGNILTREDYSSFGYDRRHRKHFYRIRLLVPEAKTKLRIGS
jgi:hypothetical protein